jgi:hypothetical protein
MRFSPFSNINPANLYLLWYFFLVVLYYRRVFAIWVSGVPKTLSANYILLYILGVLLGLAERFSRNIAGITDPVLDKRESISLIRLNLDPRIMFLERTTPRGLLLLLLLSLSAVLFFAFYMSRYIAFFFSEIIRVPLSVRGAVVTGVG